MPFELATVAVFGAIKAWFEYLATPEGQKLAAQMNTASADFNKQMADLFNKIHAEATAK